MGYTIQLGGIRNLQGLLEFVRPSAGGHLGALDEHEFHRYGAADVLRFVRPGLEGENLGRGGTDGQLIDADKTEAEELWWIGGIRWTVVDLEKDFSGLL